MADRIDYDAEIKRFDDLSRYGGGLLPQDEEALIHLIKRKQGAEAQRRYRERNREMLNRKTADYCRKRYWAERQK